MLHFGATVAVPNFVPTSNSDHSRPSATLVSVNVEAINNYHACGT